MRLLEIRGITEKKLEEIKASYAESRMLRNLITLLAPFKLTPKTALKIYEHFGPASVEILEKSLFELCQISGFEKAKTMHSGPGNVFQELIQCGLVPVTVLDVIFRQSKDSLIAHNAKFINEGNTQEGIWRTTLS